MCVVYEPQNEHARHGHKLLLQSATYFGADLREAAQGIDVVRFYELRPLPILMALPLGLLLALKQQQQLSLIERLFADRQGFLYWYERSFVADSSACLVWEAGLGLQSSERFSHSGKEQLRFRVRGFRCTAIEFLLSLAFAPFSWLCQVDSVDSLTSETANITDKTTAAAGQLLSVEREPQLAEVLSLLDFTIFEVYGEGYYIEEILRRDYRQRLRELWQIYWS